MYGASRFVHVRKFASPYPADLGGTASTGAIAAAIAAEAEQRAAAIAAAIAVEAEQRAAAIAAIAATGSMVEPIEIIGCEASDSWLVHTDNASGAFQVQATAAFDESILESVSVKLVLADDDGPINMLQTPIEWDFNITLTKDGRVANTGLYRLSLGPGTGVPGIITKLSGGVPSSDLLGTPTTDTITAAIAAAIAAEAEQRTAAIAAAAAAAAVEPIEIIGCEASDSWLVHTDNASGAFQVQATPAFYALASTPTRRNTRGPVRAIDAPTIDWDYNITLSKGGRVVNSGLYRLRLGPGMGAPGLVTKLS
ncbi:hypothetical protein T492DRAFT_915446 [Pavlovales sp. CCMP2436]|nr:hypothetical protein T492DRAFT_915446 [Pavlovales sp. CCMP2436]